MSQKKQPKEIQGEFPETNYCAVLKGINQNISYFLKISLDKLSIYPCNSNGSALKLQHFLMNDLEKHFQSLLLKSNSPSQPAIMKECGNIFFSFKIDKNISIQTLIKENDQQQRLKLLNYFLPKDSFDLIDQMMNNLLAAHQLQKTKMNFNSQSTFRIGLRKKGMTLFKTQLEMRKKIYQLEKIKINNIMTSQRPQEGEKQKTGIDEQSIDQDLRSAKTDADMGYKIPQILEMEVDEGFRFYKIKGGVSIAQKIVTKKMVYKTAESIQQIDSPSVLVKKTRKEVAPSCQNEGNHEKNAAFLNLEARFKRDLEIVKALNSGRQKQYLLKYYTDAKAYNQYYVQYAQMSLNDFLVAHRPKMGYHELIRLCLQVVKITKDLHQSGFVHRDLKPENFMVKKNTKTNKFSLKLIDFSDSAEIKSSGKQEKMTAKDIVFGTIPYSPIETQKSNQSYENKGIHNREIDFWSIGILIHIIFYGHNPVSFSRNFWKEINALWELEFLIVSRDKGGHNIHFLDRVFQRLLATTVQVKQEKRMSVESVEEILTMALQYYQNLLDSKFGFSRCQDIEVNMFEYY